MSANAISRTTIWVQCIQDNESHGERVHPDADVAAFVARVRRPHDTSFEWSARRAVGAHAAIHLA